MRAGQLAGCVLVVGLFAGSLWAAENDGRLADSKAKSVGARSAGADKTQGDGSAAFEVSRTADDDVKIEGMNQEMTLECTRGTILVQGTSNTVKLIGECQTLRVAGKSNQVSVEAVAVIKVAGIENQVTWERGVNNKPPSIQNSGINNTVSKKSR